MNLKTAEALGLTIPASVLRAGGRGHPVVDRRAFIAAIAEPRCRAACRPSAAAREGLRASAALLP